MPVSMIVAIAVGEGIAALLGYSDLTAADAPLWAKLCAGIPAYLLMLIAVVGSLRYSWIARTEADWHSWVPLGLSVMGAVYIVMMTVGSALELS
jgi:hypothetical protein